MDLRFNPETLEVLQTSDYGLRAAKSSPWTVFFSSKGDKAGFLGLGSGLRRKVFRGGTELELPEYGEPP